MTNFLYVNELGTVVEVIVPWDEGTNIIPPPTITFAMLGKRNKHTFVIMGERPA